MDAITVELDRAPLESYRAAPGQQVVRWVYRFRIDGGDWSLWDRGLPWVRQQAARQAGVRVGEVISTWTARSEGNK